MAIYQYVTAADIEDVRPNVDTAVAAIFATSANAQAAVAAPGISEAAFLSNEAAMEALKSILRGAILRWLDQAAGNAAATSHTRTAGPLSETTSTDTRQPGGQGTLWPSEEDRIRKLVPGGAVSRRAFSILTTPPPGASPHRDSCALWFGALYCDCGADLNAVTGSIPPRRAAR